MESRANSSRKRANDDDGDVTYINDANKVFNKKVRRPLSCSSFRFPTHFFSSLLMLIITSRPHTPSLPLQITRYYDKYTKEIRANFERGTAL